MNCRARIPLCFLQLYYIFQLTLHDEKFQLERLIQTVISEKNCYCKKLQCLSVAFVLPSKHLIVCLLAVLTSDKRILRNPISNVYRWHAWLWNHGGDNQELMSFTYTKNNDWTHMRFTASGDHRNIYYPGTSWDACARWYLCYAFLFFIQSNADRRIKNYSNAVESA